MQEEIIQKDNDKTKVPTVEQVERALIIKALKQCNGNVMDASRLLEIGKSTLYRKIKKYVLELYMK